MENIDKLAQAFVLAIEEACKDIDIKILDWFNGTIFDVITIKD